jgi:hypothetical protein
MTGSKTTRVMEQLWRPSPRDDPPEVYALLDGARNPRVHREVEGSRLSYVCLFSGVLAPELVETAPYLVHLSARGAFTPRLFDLAWGQSWGIFARSRSNLEDLRRHFRRLLLVRDERGRQLYFRYYDPRVLRVYLPTCTPEELKTYFGPVESFLVEERDPDVLVTYSRHPNGHLNRVWTELAKPLDAGGAT